MKNTNSTRNTALQCLGYTLIFACCLYFFLLASVLLVGGDLTPSWVYRVASFIEFSQIILQPLGITGNSLVAIVLCWAAVFFLLLFAFILSHKLKK
jgi:hypothetical protein